MRVEWPGFGCLCGVSRPSVAPATRAEPKNLDYAYFRSPADPDHLVILERYRDADGLDAHRETPHFQ